MQSLQQLRVTERQGAAETALKMNLICLSADALMIHHTVQVYMPGVIPTKYGSAWAREEERQNNRGKQHWPERALYRH